MLNSVAATSARNAWAVGSTASGTVIDHWTGTSWARVPAHAPSGADLMGVAATSARNAWVVGYSGTARVMPLILHWAGGHWTRVTGHLPANSVLTSVTAISARDAWAVGITGTSKPQTLILHWNGRSWKRQATPDPKAARASGDELWSVTAVSSRDAWAAGYLPSKVDTPEGGLLLHWNGTAWKHVPARAFASRGAAVGSVAATSASSVLAAGAGGGAGIVDRWNGRSWAKTPLLVHPAAVAVDDVAALSSRDAWAVGLYCASGHCSADEALRSMLLRWNGREWAQVAAPLSAADDLSGMAVVSASDAWAVGGTQAGHGIILHWNGTAWAKSS
jgi:hypothetical protein